MAFGVVCTKRTSTFTKQVGLKAHSSLETLLPFQKSKQNKTEIPQKHIIWSLLLHFLNMGRSTTVCWHCHGSGAQCSWFNSLTNTYSSMLCGWTHLTHPWVPFQHKGLPGIFIWVFVAFFPEAGRQLITTFAKFTAASSHNGNII